MGSVAEDKHKAALELLRKWRFRKTEKGREETLRELAALCAAEISHGLRDGGGVLAWNTQEDTVGAIRYVAFSGVQRALATAADKRPPDFPKYVQDCIAEVVRETRADQEKRLQQLEPQQVYDIVSQLSRFGAASVLDLLSFEQRNGFIALIQQRLGEGAFKVSLALEPKDDLLWLLWYAFRLHAMEPTVRQLLGDDKETPTILAIDLSGELGPQPRNKRGEPINLAGPALVKVYDVLTGLPTNNIPAPARSDVKLGLSFGVDRSVIKRWREHPEWDDLKVDIQPNDKGGVSFALDVENQLRSARIVIGRKRGPKA